MSQDGSVRLSESIEGNKVRHFVEELEQLKAKLLEQSSLVESAIYRSITAVVQKDESLARDVLTNEARINSIEIEIDDFAVNLLALQQPMAADLRFIIASIKINNDLERMGDLAVNIAQRAIALRDEPIVKPMVDIPHIAALVQSMVRKSLDSFVQRDADLARSVLAQDDAVDDLRNASFHELISFHGAGSAQHSTGSEPVISGAKPGADCGSCDEHRGGRAVHGQGDRRQAPRGSAELISGAAGYAAPRFTFARRLRRPVSWSSTLPPNQETCDTTAGCSAVSAPSALRRGRATASTAPSAFAAT